VDEFSFFPRLQMLTTALRGKYPRMDAFKAVAARHIIPEVIGCSFHRSPSVLSVMLILMLIQNNFASVLSLLRSNLVTR
jgi:hypothetical protein